MKNKLSVIAAAVAALSLTACDKTPDVQGTWSGLISPLETGGGQDLVGRNVSSQISTNLTFSGSSESKEGNVELASNIDIIDAVPFDNRVDAPYEVSVTASAQAMGTYRFVDDDDIAIVIDPASVKVTLDPDAVSYGANVLTGQQTPAQLDSLKAEFVKVYQAKVLQKVRLYYARFRKIDDVKVKDGMLSCEVNDTDLTFQRI